MRCMLRCVMRDVKLKAENQTIDQMLGKIMRKMGPFPDQSARSLYAGNVKTSLRLVMDSSTQDAYKENMIGLLTAILKPILLPAYDPDQEVGRFAELFTRLQSFDRRLFDSIGFFQNQDKVVEFLCLALIEPMPPNQIMVIETVI